MTTAAAKVLLIAAIVSSEVSRRHSVPAARRPPILRAAGHMTDGPWEVHVDARANGLTLGRSL